MSKGVVHMNQKTTPKSTTETGGDCEGFGLVRNEAHHVGMSGRREK